MSLVGRMSKSLREEIEGRQMEDRFFACPNLGVRCTDFRKIAWRLPMLQGFPNSNFSICTSNIVKTQSTCLCLLAAFFTGCYLDNGKAL